MIALLLAAGLSCGVERSAEKHLTDPLASKVDIQNVQSIQIHELANLTLREPVKGDEPRGVRPEEFQVKEIVGEVFVEKIESDRDYHIAVCELGHWDIANGCEPGFSVVTESVDPDCAPKSPVFADMLSVRLSLRRILHGPIVPLRLKRLVGKTLRIQGVVFFDKLHGQSGVAPDGAELHPILKLEAVQ